MIERLVDGPEPIQPNKVPGQPEQPVDSLVPTPNPLDDLIQPLIPGVRKPRLIDNDLTPEERADIIESRMLAEDVTKERQAEQLKTHGKTDKELEAEADAWLSAAGFDDLVEGKN